MLSTTGVSWSWLFSNEEHVVKLGTRRNRNVVIGFIVVYYPVVVRCGMRCDPGVVGVVSMEFSVSLSCVWLRCGGYTLFNI